MAYAKRGRKVYRRRKGGRRVRRVGKRRNVRGIDYYNNPLETLKILRAPRPDRYRNNSIRHVVTNNNQNLLNSLDNHRNNYGYDLAPNAKQVAKSVLGIAGRNVRAVGHFADRFVPFGLAGMVGDGLNYLLHGAGDNITANEFKTNSKPLNYALSFLDGYERGGDNINQYTDFVGQTMLDIAAGKGPSMPTTISGPVKEVLGRLNPFTPGANKVNIPYLDETLDRLSRFGDDMEKYSIKEAHRKFKIRDKPNTSFGRPERVVEYLGFDSNPLKEYTPSKLPGFTMEEMRQKFPDMVDITPREKPKLNYKLPGTQMRDVLIGPPRQSARLKETIQLTQDYVPEVLSKKFYDKKKLKERKLDNLMASIKHHPGGWFNYNNNNPDPDLI